MTMSGARLSRRAFLGAGAALSALTVLPSRTGQAKAPAPFVPTRTLTLKAGETELKLLGPDKPATRILAYDGTPFQTLRLPRGTKLEATFENGLDEGSTLHFHGIRMPNEFDGVPTLTQPLVEAGGRFVYRIPLDDPGTFFFHPHCDETGQAGKGLAGVLIVEDRRDPKFDAEHVLCLKDWRLADDGNFLPLSEPDSASKAGTFGGTRTVNGAPSVELTAPAGGDVRLRILNIDATRIMDIGVSHGEAWLIAVDGHALKPVRLDDLKDGIWRMGPAQRIDLHVRMPADGSAVSIGDYRAADIYQFATLKAEGRVAKPRKGPLALPAADLPRPDVKKATRYSFTLQQATDAAVKGDRAATGRSAGQGADRLTLRRRDHLLGDRQEILAHRRAPPSAATAGGDDGGQELPRRDPQRDALSPPGASARPRLRRAVLQPRPPAAPLCRYGAGAAGRGGGDRLRRRAGRLGVPLPHPGAYGDRDDGLVPGGVMGTARRLLQCVALAAAMLPLGVATADDTGLDAAIGKALFERPWVPAPSSTRANDGLGPLFDARSCSACHHGGAGKSATALNEKGQPDGLGMVLSLFREDGGGDPVYGHRLETMTLPGVPAEGTFAVATEDGRRITHIAEPGYGPLDAATHVSLRTAPDLRGRGKLELVDDDAILALEDPDDRDGDGVRGRARRLEHPEGGSIIGRFGWKASHATLAGQTSEAFALDLGLSTPLRPEPWGDCTEAQSRLPQRPARARSGGRAGDHQRHRRAHRRLSARPQGAAGRGRPARGEAVRRHRLRRLSPALAADPRWRQGGALYRRAAARHGRGARRSRRRSRRGGCRTAHRPARRSLHLAGARRRAAARWPRFERRGGGALAWRRGVGRARFEALDAARRRALIDYVSSL